MIKSKDVDAAFKALKKHKEELVKLCDVIDKGWKDAQTSGDDLYNELADLETKAGGPDKAAYAKVIKVFEKETEKWSGAVSGIEYMIADMNKAYSGIFK